jgi:hypothetical protein
MTGLMMMMMMMMMMIHNGHGLLFSSLVDLSTAI